MPEGGWFLIFLEFEFFFFGNAFYFFEFGSVGFPRVLECSFGFYFELGRSIEEGFGVGLGSGSEFTDDVV